MIYAELPLSCRFFPINTDDEVFQTVFMFHFQDFLEVVSTLFMEMINDADKLDMTDGEVLFFADWAKRCYNNKEKIKDNMQEFKQYCFNNKHKKYILDNVNPHHIGFDFVNLTYNNVNDGNKLYNTILAKL